MQNEGIKRMKKLAAVFAIGPPYSFFLNPSQVLSFDPMRFLLCFIGILFSISPLQAQNDSLLQIVRSSQTHDTLKAKAYGDLSFESRSSSSDQAYAYALASLHYAKKANHTASLAQAWNDLGIIYYDRALYDSALFCYETAMPLRKKMGDLKGLGGLYNKIGIVFQSRGQFVDAMRAQLQSLRYYDSLGWDYGIAYAQNNIAVLHYNLGSPDKALEYYQKSADLKLKIGDKDGYGGTLSNMGNVYHDQKKYREAIHTYLLALDYIDTTRNKYYLASTLNNLGNVYSKINKFDSAFYYVKKGLLIREAAGDKKGMVSSLSQLGNLYVTTFDYKNGLPFLERALELAREIHVIKDHKDVLISLAAAHYVQGNYKVAYEYLSEGKQLNDSIFSESLSRSVSELQIKYETERRIRENLELKSAREVQDADLAAKGLQVRFLVTGLLVILLLFVLIFQLYRNKQRQTLAASIKSMEQKRFRSILETEEKERARIARELHDGLSQLIVSAKLHVDAVEAPDDEKVFLTTAANLLNESLEEVRNISHDLMPGALLRLGLQNAIMESVERITGNHKIEIVTELKVDKNPSEDISLALFRIYQECLSNMIKYSGASKIVVHLHEDVTGIILQMEDNGKGFDTRLIEASKGIGWDNIHFRVNLFKGRFEVKSSAEQGTRIEVRIPATTMVLSER